jgi:hypothetical protein
VLAEESSMEDVKRDSKAPARKRAYRPPAIEDTAGFETLALTCGKFPDNINCSYSGGPQNS